MRIRIDREVANARRLRDMYVEDIAVRAAVGLDLAIRRAAAYVAALVTEQEEPARARGTSCRS